jgi:hypothetical protein
MLGNDHASPKARGTVKSLYGKSHRRKSDPERFFFDVTYRSFVPCDAAECQSVRDRDQLHNKSIFREARSIASGVVAFTNSSLAASQRAAAASATGCTA